MKEIKFRCRPVGLDLIDCCYVCNATKRSSDSNHYMNNIAAFVDSKEDGAEVVKMFNGVGARLDYRDYEPNWIQVKIGSCDNCLPCLEELSRLTRSGTIYKRDIILSKVVL
jgi:hypothetical protein